MKPGFNFIHQHIVHFILIGFAFLPIMKLTDQFFFNVEPGEFEIMAGTNSQQGISEKIIKK